MFDCFLLILLSLSLLQLFQIVVLSSCPLLEVVSLCLQLHDQIPKLLRLHLQVLRVHPIELKRPYSNTERNLFLLLQLLLGLGHLSPDVHHISHPFILLLASLSASCWANFFSCSALISFLLACFSFSFFSSSSSLALCFLHSLMYSFSCSSSSPFLASPLALRKFPSPFLEVFERDSSSAYSSSDMVMQVSEWRSEGESFLDLSYLECSSPLSP